MGLDNPIDDFDDQLVDQSASNGLWGSPDQIDESERGRVPDKIQPLLVRIIDEQVRQALEAGYDHDTVAGVLGIHRRTTFKKKHRGYAYDCPLEILPQQGRPATTGDSESANAWNQINRNALSESAEITQHDEYVEIPGVLMRLSADEQNALMSYCAKERQPLGDFIKKPNSITCGR
jgi:hypothetical protein